MKKLIKDKPASREAGVARLTEEANVSQRTLILKMLVFGVLIFWMPYVFVWFVVGYSYPLAYRYFAVA